MLGTVVAQWVVGLPRTKFTSALTGSAMSGFKRRTPYRKNVEKEVLEALPEPHSRFEDLTGDGRCAGDQRVGDAQLQPVDAELVGEKGMRGGGVAVDVEIESLSRQKTASESTRRIAAAEATVDVLHAAAGDVVAQKALLVTFATEEAA